MLQTKRLPQSSRYILKNISPTRTNSPLGALLLHRTRNYASHSALEDFYHPKKRRFGPWFIGFLAVGFGMTAYGGYILYETLTIWPPEVRADLRDALTAKMKGDLHLSERYFHRAWKTIQTLPISSLGTQPYLKLTGVAVSLADVLEVANKPERAYDVCAEALGILQREDVMGTLKGPERLRGVALASKLGELAEQLGKPREEEEKWKVWAVEEILRVVKAEATEEKKTLDLPMMPLPKWITKADVGAPLQQLGAFYARTGKLEYAMPLYLQAISLLIPPAPKQSSPEDRCRGAQLMGDLSELLMRGKPTPERIHQAEAWATQALAVLQKTRGELNRKEIRICEAAYAAALFNVAAFKEMANDTQTARKLYKEGLEQSRAISMQEGIVEASEALMRLDSEPGRKE
ncbi:hypothetical protein E1B28_011786 [Marasmius oreades]|uniref:Uncharacterized protein n=1 Tax=Marasmius oreades TaxID=181124 RepID=A0A9P7RUV1_9AGAR|nr:uncharacterized protein E1B28_011786 [Marasmius oreades]KAG7090179.1 hypothetical protein E1B28_011786 [Marasmius oreades]